jgi:outer membrane receptor for ferrienterochelin and colicin
MLTAQEKRGEISGQVIDGTSHQPLLGVNVVVVEKPTIGGTTDENGNFFINNLEVGEYSLRTTLVGYTTSVTTDVVVSTGRSTKVKVKLDEQSVQVEGVEVNADYFSVAGAISPVSTIGLDGAEVKRSPGSAQDMQRIVQSMPNVATSTDESNELIVRGGAPNENLTVMDYIEIPSTNHYPNELNSGGPINMVNVDLIEDIRFSTGGFPAQYGDKLSSVMDITTREGDRRHDFSSNTGFNFAGFGTVMEGAIDGGRGSWLFSARQSLLETIDNVVGISSLGLTAIPKYYDTQWKAVYDLSPSQKLILSGIYGNDKILIKGDPKEKNEQKVGVSDSSSVETVDVHKSQYAGGVSLKSLWGEKGFSVLTLSSLGNKSNVDVRDDFTSRTYGASGEVLTNRLLNSRTTFSDNSYDSYVGLKYDVVYYLHTNHEISAGAQYFGIWKFDNSTQWYSEIKRYDLNNDGIFESGPVTFPDGNVTDHLGFASENKSYGYLSDKIRLSDSFRLTIGGRYDYFSYSQKGNLSPRFSASYDILPQTTKLNFAYGEFYQTQSLPYYGDNRGLGINKKLKNSHARHFVLGVEHIFTKGLKASIEGYTKEYSDLPVSEQFIYSADKAFRSDKYLNVGKRTSRGIELFIQQKQVETYYGTLSLSYSKTEDVDPRIPRRVSTYPSEYDYPVLATLVAGKVVRGTRDALNTTPFFIKYPLMLIPLSDDMEISLRFRYSTGRPRTSPKFVTNVQRWIGGTAWSTGSWEYGDDVNNDRYPDYQRLDIQWISRYHYTGFNIVVYMAVENLYNHDNIAMYQYSSDGTTQTIHQFAFFPIGGFSVEF